MNILSAPYDLDWVEFVVAMNKMRAAVHAARRIRDGEPDLEQYWAWVEGLKPGDLVQIDLVGYTRKPPVLLDIYQVEHITPKQLVVAGWWAPFRRVQPTKGRRTGVGIGGCVRTEPGGARARLKMPSQATLETAAKKGKNQ